MLVLPELFDNNRRWADATTASDPDFFTRLAAGQTPQYLWIGCSDSRAPANQIIGLRPGEVFVHRNIANLVRDGDANVVAVLDFAIASLLVSHVIVCGHYGCGGVRASLDPAGIPSVDEWVEPIRALGLQHRGIVGVDDEQKRVDRLCELNALHQARAAARTRAVQQAWAGGQRIAVHAWIYGIHDGRLRDLGFTVETEAQIEPAFSRAVERLAGASCPLPPSCRGPAPV
ncbi:MAG: carbonic anhydrase [Acidobacteria bacterium]|nr:carbonic anhydrase [Acidobacteriota bacterium]